MSAISIMELNTKSPFIWDWDNLVVFPSRAADVPKKLQLVESEFEGIEGFEIGSLHSSGGRSDVGSGSGGSASNLANGSSSKSSKSASVDSSINREMRESKFTLETSDCFSQNLSNRKELASAWPSSAPSMTEISIGSGESLIGLKLGKRTYFEDVSGGINGKSSSGSVPAPSCAAVKKSKSSSQSTEIPRCQVEACNLDLSSAKDYHRKHRVCEIHSKSPKVVICGVERRFCQQCSRFHSLSEFDQRKRSCRRRLSDHNARRRKPKPEIIQFNSMRLSSSLHEGRSLAFNQVPMVQTRPNSNTTWDFTSNSKFTQEKLSLFSPTKSGGIDSLHVTRNGPQETVFKLSYDSSQVLPPKSAASEVFHQGFEVSTTPTNNMDAAQDLRALSLLSTNSWGSSCPQEHAPPLDHSGMLQLHQTHPLDLPPVSVSAEYNQFPEFQLFKAPNEPNYYLYEDLR